MKKLLILLGLVFSFSTIAETEFVPRCISSLEPLVMEELKHELEVNIIKDRVEFLCKCFNTNEHKEDILKVMINDNPTDSQVKYIMNLDLKCRKGV